MSEKKPKISDRKRKRKHKIRAIKFWFIIHIIIPVAWIFATFYFRTWRVSPELIERCLEVTSRDKRVFLLWHTHIILNLGIMYRIHKKMKVPMAILMSPSRDGEVMGSIVRKTGHRVVRGSSNKRGVASLIEFRQVLEENANPMFFVDGPKGPRGFPKSGFLHLLLHQELETYISFMAPKKYWSLKTWDRQMIPLPFTKIDGLVEQTSEFSDISEKEEFLQQIHEQFIENSKKFNQDTSDIKKHD